MSKDDEKIVSYLDYWMDNDPNFSKILSNKNNAVVDVEYYASDGVPRACIIMEDELLLLFPPLNLNFDYNNAK